MRARMSSIAIVARVAAMPGTLWPPVAVGKSADVDGRIERDARIEILDVRDRHADAAVRRGGSDRGDLVRAVDAGAVEEAHPAGLDRVVGAGRDDAAGEVAGPGAERHVPRRIYLLVVDRVLARGCLEARAPDGDPVRLHEPEALVEAERERLAADEDVGAVVPRQAEEARARPHR